MQTRYGMRLRFYPLTQPSPPWGRGLGEGVLSAFTSSLSYLVDAQCSC